MDKLGKNKELVEALLKMINREYLSKQDFISSLKNVVNKIDKTEKSVSSDLEEIHSIIADLQKEVQDNKIDDYEDVKKRFALEMEDLKRLLADYEAGDKEELAKVSKIFKDLKSDIFNQYSKLAKRISKVKNGRDGKDGKDGVDGRNADEEKIIRGIAESIKIPDVVSINPDQLKDLSREVENPLAELIKDGRLQVEVDRVGGGGGFKTVSLYNTSDQKINPMTEETGQAILAASGGSVYNYIQSATDATYKYYGYASSTGWKFKRKTLSTGVWQVAEGLGDYDTAWADRASKTYNYV